MKRQRRGPSQRWLLTAAASVLVWTGASAGIAQEMADFPTQFQFEKHNLQKVPSVFKFQSRISQAKIPVGDGRFKTVVVNLKRGDATLCQESFTDVRVQDSVLNLEIGRTMSCELDAVLAENPGLYLQVCIGGTENCLKPIELGTVPYAVKSSFAAQAQAAHKANIAAQAHYAHRATADRDLLLRGELGKGYLDFYTPAVPDGLYTTAEFPRYANGGFIRWTPTSSDGKALTIAGKDEATDKAGPLEEFVVHSKNTRVRGRLVAEGGVTIPSDGDVTTTEVTIEGDIVAGRADALNQNKLTVYADSTFMGNVLFKGNVSVGGQITGTATDVECAQCVNSGDLADGAITGQKLLAAAVGSRHIADGAVTSQHIAERTIGLSDLAPAVALVPIGGVIDWWRPDAATPVPDGFKIADGSVVSDPQSPFNGRAVPNLVGKFVQGISQDVARNNSGMTLGGQKDHSHRVAMPRHKHRYSLEHDHAPFFATAEEAGMHSHVWAKWDVGQHAWTSGDGQGIVNWGDGMDADGKGEYPLGGEMNASAIFNTDRVGNHIHTVRVDVPRFVMDKETMEAGPFEFGASQTEHLPPFAGLIKLIRIR